MPDGFTVEEYTVERPFFHEEEPVLTCYLRLPKVTGRGAAVQRIDRYYRRLMARLIRCWERRLYPRACADAQEAREASYPFQPYETRVTFQVTCQRDDLLSLYWDNWLYTGGAHGETLRHGDTWSAKDGCPLPMSAFFPPKTKLRKTLVPLAAQQAQANLAAGTSLYFEDFPQRMLRAFDRDHFYLTEEGLALFYPLYSIAPYAEGIPTFSIPLPREHTAEGEE